MTAQTPGGKVATALFLAALGLTLARRPLSAKLHRPRESASSPPKPATPDPKKISTQAGRDLSVGAAVLSIAVFADSGVEHYRGAFKNPAMFMPLVASSLNLGASLFGANDKRASAHWARDSAFALAAATGFGGFCFHIYNINKRPGGFSWLNLFYSAPVGAPFALMLAGLLGRGAERVRASDSSPPKVFGLPAAPILAGVCSVGLFGTMGEAGLLHFRGSYQDPFMFLPVSVPPAAAAFLARAAVGPSASALSMARAWLQLTAALGVLGVGFHTYGVARNMGGWRNWSQNILNGPPIPAPPSFTGLALGGLAALDMLREDANV